MRVPLLWVALIGDKTHLTAQNPMADHRPTSLRDGELDRPILIVATEFISWFFTNAALIRRAVIKDRHFRRRPTY